MRFLNPRNGANLTNVIDATASSINLFQENEQLKHIYELFIPQTSISIAEPTGVQIDELDNSNIQMYQLTGIINDGKVPGLETILYYMGENLL